MKLILTVLFGVVLLLGCSDQAEDTFKDRSDGLEAGETLIGAFQVKPSESIVFEHSFNQPQWIGFNTNISVAEMDRFDNEEEEYSAVKLSQLGSDHYVGSHSGAETVFTPVTNGVNKFEITNHSRETLTITVYWKPK